MTASTKGVRKLPWTNDAVATKSWLEPSDEKAGSIASAKDATNTSGNLEGGDEIAELLDSIAMIDVQDTQEMDGNSPRDLMMTGAIAPEAPEGPIPDLI